MMSGQPRGGAERLYARLLYCYPAGFRRAYLMDLLQIFRLRHGRVRRRSMRARLVFWADALWDVAWNGLAVRLGRQRGPRMIGPRLPRKPRGFGVPTLLEDIRHSVRLIRKQPGFAAVVVLTLGLGIGANTTIFSFVNGVLLAPLPYADPDGLVRIWEHDLNEGRAHRNLSPADFHDYQEQTTALRAIGAYTSRGATLTEGADPERVSAQLFTPHVFDLLGVEALVGRTLGPGDELGDGNAVVLSYGFWQRRFGGDDGVVGTAISLNRTPFTVVGVMPPDFRPFLGTTDLWAPWDLTGDRRRPVHFLRVVGRLNSGATLADARADLMTIARRLEADYPDVNSGHLVTVESLRDAIVGAIRPGLFMMMAAVGFVLLIACANLANLFLSRNLGRQREMAVRGALGAGRGRLIRQLVTENLVLSVLGGLAGVAVAFVSLRGVLGLGLGDVPRVEQIGLHPPVFAFAFVLAVATGVLFGLGPSMLASRQDLGHALKDGGNAANGSVATRRLRSGLLVVQMALAIVLLIGAGLLLRSFDRLQRVDPGFDIDHILVASVSLPGSRYPNIEDLTQFQAELRTGLEADANVSRVGTVTFPPFSGNSSTAGLNILGRPPWPDFPPEVNIINVSGDYFRAMGVSLLGGRLFESRDRADTPRVTVINETMARRYWPDEDPIGQQIRLGPNAESRPWEIIGVVSDMRQYELKDEPSPASFSVSSQERWRSFYVTLQTTGEPRGAIGAFRSRLKVLDPDLAPGTVATMADMVGASVTAPRVGMILLGAFAMVALGIAAVGVYGVVAYSVTQRTQEFGIRMALGAAHRHVFSMVLYQVLALASLAVVIGVGIATASSRVLASTLYEVSALDPITFFAVPILLAAVAALASYLPARRAIRVNPVAALRAE